MSHEIPNTNPEIIHEKKLDLSTQDWTDRLAEAPIYIKTVLVHIRRASPGSHIKTILANGRFEMEAIAGANEVVITNPGGEEQIVSMAKAMQRYEPTDTPRVFRSKGMVRAIDNPTGGPIVIQTSGGKPQHGDQQCKIASLIDPLHPEIIDQDRYIIGGDEFNNTYKIQLEKIGVDSSLSSEFTSTLERAEEDFIPLGTIGVISRQCGVSRTIAEDLRVQPHRRHAR